MVLMVMEEFKSSLQFLIENNAKIHKQIQKINRNIVKMEQHGDTEKGTLP